MNNKRKVSCPFGLLNIGGLMKTQPIKDVDEVIGAEVVTPLFCHQTYKIKPTFNISLDSSFAIIHIKNDIHDGKHYQKKFRRMVMWDFGDGHKEEGYSVEHSYSKPGRYKITCTFYDINRCAWNNSYHIYVSVKEIIPTQLSFVNDFTFSDGTTKIYTKPDIVCSKIERIARLEALLSLSTEDDLQVKAQRIFTEDEIDNNYEEIGRNYSEIPDEILKFTRKYWTFLENKQQLIFQSDKVYGDNLKPQDLYTPNYINLYGRFYYDSQSEDEPIKLALYQVIPYKTIDEELKTIRVLNPNCNLDELLAHSETYEEYKDLYTRVIDIKQVYTIDQLPDSVFFIGKRAFVDIFYKNDFLTTGNHKNTFSFYYDIETKNITKELSSSDNYLNINPLGLSVNVGRNNIDKVRFGISLDGFLRELSEEDNWSAKQYYIDPYLMNSLVKDIDLDFYLFPYIEYNSVQEVVDGTDLVISDGVQDDFVTSSKMYYVPKDCEIRSITPIQNRANSNQKGEASEWNNERNVEIIEPWLKRISFRLLDYINYTIIADISGVQYEANVVRDELIKPDEIEIPTEQMVREDINELVQTYLSHPMFDEADNVKEFFKTILKGKNLINYTLTKSNHFLDDYANIRTCYLSSLIQMLKMMGEDVLEYEKGGFEGVNDLRDFVRLLTMNHSDLVGHVIGDKVDITVQLDRKGKNVSDEIKVSDLLQMERADTSHNRGKIKKFTRNNKTYDCKQIHKNGVDLIVQDKYTFETKIVNLRLVEDSELDANGCVKISDYRPSWGWNLLLPQRFNDCLYKLNENEKYKAEHGRDQYSKRDLDRIKQTAAQIIDGYYAFYLLNPNVDSKRVGNFLDESSITERVNDTEDWYSKWGITHEILMKIFRDNGNYKHSTYVIENDSSEYSMRRIIDDNSLYGVLDTEITNIHNSVYQDDMMDYESYINSVIKVYGVLCEGTEQYLEMTLTGTLSDEDVTIDIKTEEPQLLFKVKMDENGVIHPTKQVYNVYADGYKGTLTISLCGKIKKEKGVLKGFLWDASLDLFSVK